MTKKQNEYNQSVSIQCRFYEIYISKMLQNKIYFCCVYFKYIFLFNYLFINNLLSKTFCITMIINKIT
jgi:hypothetical protein